MRKTSDGSREIADMTCLQAKVNKICNSPT